MLALRTIGAGVARRSARPLCGASIPKTSMTVRDALNSALDEELERDEKVFLYVERVEGVCFFAFIFIYFFFFPDFHCPRKVVPCTSVGGDFSRLVAGFMLLYFYD
jgi:hypothetical protein